jgi:hypothetical protein
MVYCTILQGLYTHIYISLCNKPLKESGLKMEKCEKVVDADEEYEEEGFVQQNVMAIVTLIVGVAIGTIVIIFAGALGGQTYSVVEDDINGINNSTIQGYIKDGIVAGFQALSQTGGYMPLIVLGVVIFLVLSLILGLGFFTSMGGGSGGGAL